jgi:gentisate 1,2-dioxygenase
MIMEPGDLLIQPNFAWHDHVNDSKEPIIWIDSLDGGLVNFLNASFREDWAEGKQQPLTKTSGASRRLYGPVRQPVIDQGAGVPYHYKWGETLEALEEMAQQGVHDPYDGVLLEYKTPLAGPYVFDDDLPHSNAAARTGPEVSPPHQRSRYHSVGTA